MLASLVFIATLAATALASHTPTSTHPFRRAAKITGCTCCGFSFAYGSDPDQSKWTSGFILNWGVEGSGNDGWCFTDGVLNKDNRDDILVAIQNQMDTPYFNYTMGSVKCALNGWNTDEACADGIIKEYSEFIVGPNGDQNSGWIHTYCNWPANAHTSDCFCGWECNIGYVKCGNSCIDPMTQVCSSGFPAPKRRNFTPSCPYGQTLCPTPNNSFKCIDTSSNLEACGACPYQAGTTDCTSLPGTDAVRCESGKCIADACIAGYKLVDGACETL